MKNLITKISLFLKKLTGKALTLLRNNAGISVQITARLKEIVESKAAATAVNLIPGNLDNATLEVLKRILPLVSEKLAVVFGALRDNSKNSDAVTVIISRLRELEPDLRGSFYLAFSAELNVALSDGKLSLAEAAALAQMLYVEIKESRKV